MPEENISGVVKVKPEPSKAMFAIEAAADLVESARIGIRQNNFEQAYEDSKNAIRMASSAIMYNDGYIANSLDGAYDYMEKVQGKKELVEDWRNIEIKSPENTGFFDRILDFLRLKKKSYVNTEESARKALSVAEVFVQSARTIVMVGGTPSWERTVKTG